MPALKGGRNATLGEVPWVVLLKSVMSREGYQESPQICGGSVIANQWVLTAAHCLDFFRDMKIYIGYNFTPTEVDHLPYYKIKTSHKHQQYDMTDQFGKADITLIQLDKPINTSANRLEFAVENSICLPERGIKERRGEYAMVSGWGNTVQERRPLPIGYRVIDTKGRNWTKEFFHISPDNSTKLCPGDSGSPIWQYHIGRAILIGVMSRSCQYSCPYGNEYPDYDKCANSGIAVRVSAYIDWIMNVTKLN